MVSQKYIQEYMCSYIEGVILINRSSSLFTFKFRILKNAMMNLERK